MMLRERQRQRQTGRETDRGARTRRQTEIDRNKDTQREREDIKVWKIKKWRTFLRRASLTADRNLFKEAGHRRARCIITLTGPVPSPGS